MKNVKNILCMLAKIYESLNKQRMLILTHKTRNRRLAF